MYIFRKVLKNTNLFIKSDLQLCKTEVSYGPWTGFVTRREYEFNIDLLNSLWSERKWEIQKGGHKQEVETKWKQKNLTCSLAIPESNIIQTTTPDSTRSMHIDHVTKLKETGSGKSKMVKCVSQLPDKIATQFQRLYLCFRGWASQWNLYF
jgi:hypothetical protein